jgi:two-component system cell cycle sensor histidine kinase/response regulator CckA
MDDRRPPAPGTDADDARVEGAGSVPDASSGRLASAGSVASPGSDASPGRPSSATPPDAGVRAVSRSGPVAGSAVSGDAPADQAGFDVLRLVTRDAAHDVNNLLMAASAYAALALKDLAHDSPGRDAVERVESTMRAAAALNRQLLELTGADPAKAGPSDVAAALTGIDELLRVAAGPGTDLRLELPASLPPAAVPRRAFQRAIVSLVLAGRALRRDGQGTLTLRASMRGDGRIAIDLATTDAGVAEGATENAGGGTGKDGGRAGGVAAGGRADLVLSGIAAEISAYGGVVEGDRARMTLEVLVPVAGGAGSEARPGPASRIPASWPAGRPPVVLVVEDEDAVRRVAGRLLESIGCVVELADGGAEGVERFRADPGQYDAVLLDLSMPGLAGVDVLKGVREARAEAAVVLMSGYAPADLTAELRAQSVTFLQKPFSRASLLEALQDALSTTPGP